jgi:hypothetical protein
MEEPLVSVILTNYNGLNYIKECLDSLNNICYRNTEIIFVDNNSHDESINYVKRNYPNVKVIQNKKDYGVSRAYNIGASQAGGKYIALLNIDTQVDKNWLTSLVEVIESSEEIGAVVSKIYNYYDKKIIDYAGGICDKFGKTRHIGQRKKDRKLFNIQRETFFACGTALLIRMTLYKKIGLFDPLYYAYCEDLDLSWRIWLAGYKIIYVPTSFIYHKISKILGRESFKKTYYFGERNLLRTILKNYEIKTLIRILPIYFGKRIGIAIKYLLTLKKSFLLILYSFIKALFWNIYQFPSLIINRIRVKALRKKKDSFILQLMNNSVR